jgi:branched-chain amino acid transport system substrate-binding protein
VFLVALAAAAGSVGACGDNQESSSAAGSSSASTDQKPTSNRDLVIGLAMAKTGFINFYDGPVMQGIDMKVAEINAKGGVAGRKLRVVVSDTHSKVADATTAAQKVISEGADVVWNSSDAGFGGPAARVANQQGKLSLGAVGGGSFGKQAMGPLTFNVYQGNATEAKMLADATTKKGWNKLYLLTDSTLEYTKQQCKLMEDLRGGEAIAGKDTFVQTDQSIASQIGRIKQSSADAIMLCSYPPGGASAIRQIRAAGITLPIIGPATFDGAFWIAAVPNVSNVYNTSIASMYGDDPRPAVNEFFDAYRKKFGKEPPIAYPALGAQGVELIARALEATKGDSDGKKLAGAIEGFTSIDTLLGPTTYSADCHTPLGRGLPFMQWQKGKGSMVEFVEPKDVPKLGC